MIATISSSLSQLPGQARLFCILTGFFWWCLACGWRPGLVERIEESLLRDIQIAIAACALVFQPVNGIVGQHDTAGNDGASRKYGYRRCQAYLIVATAVDKRILVRHPERHAPGRGLAGGWGGLHFIHHGHDTGRQRKSQRDYRECLRNIHLIGLPEDGYFLAQSCASL